MVLEAESLILLRKMGKAMKYLPVGRMKEQPFPSEENGCSVGVIYGYLGWRTGFCRVIPSIVRLHKIVRLAYSTGNLWTVLSLYMGRVLWKTTSLRTCMISPSGAMSRRR